MFFQAHLTGTESKVSLMYTQLPKLILHWRTDLDIYEQVIAIKQNYSGCNGLKLKVHLDEKWGHEASR